MRHLLTSLKEVDFVTAWKAISIALTGGFGILGLLTEFKNKHTKKITNWGRVSLAGILVSSVCGIAAQLKESANDSAKALVLAQKTDKTLNEIERGLYRLEDPEVFINFAVPCHEEKYKTFCQKLDRRDPQRDSRRWVGWPMENSEDLTIYLDVFVSEGEAERFEADPRYGGGDLSLYVGITGEPGDAQVFVSAVSDDAENVKVTLVQKHAKIVRNDGKAASMLDFDGATLILWNDTFSFHGLRPVGFAIETKDGQEVHMPRDSKLEEKTTRTETLYIYKFRK
jgi:hypothetical protein